MNYFLSDRMFVKVIWKHLNDVDMEKSNRRTGRNCEIKPVTPDQKIAASNLVQGKVLHVPLTTLIFSGK